MREANRNQSGSVLVASSLSEGAMDARSLPLDPFIP